MRFGSPRTRWRILSGVLGLLVLATSLSGCGPSVGSVKGRVLLPNGEPLTGGQITFVSKDGKGKPASGIIKPDGTYEVSGAPVGPCNIGVNNEMLKPGGAPAPVGIVGMGMGSGPQGIMKDMAPKKDQMAVKEKAGPAPPAVGQVDKVEGTYVEINKKYHDPATSGLGFEVKKGKNEFEVKLPQ